MKKVKYYYAEKHSKESYLYKCENDRFFRLEWDGNEVIGWELASDFELKTITVVNLSYFLNLGGNYCNLCRLFFKKQFYDDLLSTDLTKG